MIGVEDIKNLGNNVLFLTRKANQPSQENVRFEEQIYTDRCLTIEFQNLYNPKFYLIKLGKI